MSNFNTVADVILHQNNGNPITLAFPGNVGHQQILLGAGPAVLSVPNPMSAINWTGEYVGRAASIIPFSIAAAGTITAPGAGALQIDINLGTALAPAIASTGIVRLSPSSEQADNWLLAMECLWDPTSTNVRGVFYGWVGNVNIAQQVLLTNTATGLTNLQFNVGITFLNANPLNSITLTEFSADLF